MNIRAPQDGIITTWEVKKNLMGRPVEIGQELLNIAAIGGDSDWVLEVEVPDDDMGPVLAAQSKLQAEIAAGKKQPGAALRPTSSRRPNPSTATRATSAGSPPRPRRSSRSTSSR